MTHYSNPVGQPEKNLGTFIRTDNITVLKFSGTHYFDMSVTHLRSFGIFRQAFHTLPEVKKMTIFSAGKLNLTCLPGRFQQNHKSTTLLNYKKVSSQCILIRTSL